MAINVADVISEYGDYYLNHGQNQSSLIQRLHRPSVTAAEFRTIPTKDTVVRFGSSEMSRILQPFQKAFTPIGDVTFKPNPINLFNLKVDYEEMPDDLVNSWLGFLEGDGVVRSEWPFVRWIMEVHISARVAEDFELNEAWAGNFTAPTPGTAGAAGTAMDGIKQIMADNSAKINTISMGAVPTADEDVVTYVEDFVAQISKEYRKRITKLYMNEDLHLQYRRGKRNKYNQNYAQEADLDRVIDFPQMSVMGLPSMGTDTTMWCTLEANKVRPLKKVEFGNMQVREFAARKVSIYTDYWTVLSFARMEDVFRTDV